MISVPLICISHNPPSSCASTEILLCNTAIISVQSVFLPDCFCCILLLTSDIAAGNFHGQPKNTAYCMVKVSNFPVFFIHFIYRSLFSIFLWKSLAGLGQKFLKLPPLYFYFTMDYPFRIIYAAFQIFISYHLRISFRKTSSAISSPLPFICIQSKYICRGDTTADSSITL